MILEKSLLNCAFLNRRYETERFQGKQIRSMNLFMKWCVVYYGTYKKCLRK